MKRTKEDAEETKNKILEAGLNVFSRKGFSAATLIDIAAEAGVTRGAVYWHFKNKEELYFQLNEKYNMMFFGKINDLLSEDMKAGEKLKVIISYLFGMLEDNKEFRMIEEINHTGKSDSIPNNNAMCEYFSGAKQEKWETVKALIEKGKEDGEIRKDIDSASMTDAILGYVFGVELLWLQDCSKFSIKERCTDFVNILIKGISV